MLYGCAQEIHRFWWNCYLREVWEFVQIFLLKILWILKILMTYQRFFCIFCTQWYALEIVCSCASMQIVSLLNVAFVVFREYSTVSHPPRQSALPLILFSLGQSWVDQRGLYLSTLSQRVAEVDLTHLPLQMFHPWLHGKKTYNAVLGFLIKQNWICTSSPYY